MRYITKVTQLAGATDQLTKFSCNIDTREKKMYLTTSNLLMIWMLYKVHVKFHFKTPFSCNGGLCETSKDEITNHKDIRY